MTERRIKCLVKNDQRKLWLLFKHDKFTGFCPTARKICLKALVKVLGFIYSKLTIDRAEDTQPHIHTYIKDITKRAMI